VSSTEGLTATYAAAFELYILAYQTGTEDLRTVFDLANNNFNIIAMKK